MTSILERIKSAQKSFEESQKRKRELIAEEKKAYKEAKEAQTKIETAKKKVAEQNKHNAKIEKAREAGIKAALPGATKTQIKQLAEKGAVAGVKGASGLGAFLKAHVKFEPERRSRPTKKRKMTHKKMGGKKGSATSRRVR